MVPVEGLNLTEQGVVLSARTNQWVSRASVGGDAAPC